MSFLNIYEDDGGVTCPGCGKHWDKEDLWHWFQSLDYARTFELDHEGCDRKPQIEVESQPDFSRVRERGEKGPTVRKAGDTRWQLGNTMETPSRGKE